MTELKSKQFKVQSIKILGVRVDLIKKKRLGKVLLKILQSSGQHYLATINPEFVIRARQSKKFQQILNYSDLNTCDGVGIQWAAKFLSLPVPDYSVKNRAKKISLKRKKIYFQAYSSLFFGFIFPPYLKSIVPNRFTGVNLIKSLAKITRDFDHSIFILGGAPGVADKAKHELEKKYPKVLITATSSGYLKPDQSQAKWLKAINASAADLLIVALGSPKQEKWIFKNLDKLPAVKLAVGVGGAVDYISKAKKRAPKWIRIMGMEWLFRLFYEPWRHPRIKKATFVFIKKVINYKLKKFSHYD
ncbi:MAG: WecB/TagA/CpsF family glycosyltransferase [Candidatus Moranbacteria bacterium]|nr:WecB/TagA/CpsF family glycosyltransferase [Candidatus Moranbacteria bacterium]